MKKIDLKKELKELYSPSPDEVEIVRVPKFKYLMIDGHGDPNTSREFQEAMQALYAAAYTLKFMVKKQKEVDYPVMAPEGLWWTSDAVYDMSDKSNWNWTLMILQPPVITNAFLRKALKQAVEKKGYPALSRLRLEPLHEGLSVQIMHLGPYASEASTIQTLHAFAAARGLQLRGKHHEIYLSDPRRAKPEKMKTVIRQPVSQSPSKPK